MKRLARVFSIVAVAILIAAGGLPPLPTQAQERPLIFAIIPSQDVQQVMGVATTLARMMEVATGLKVEATVPTSYAAVIEAMCAGRVDIAILGAFAYVLGKQRCDVEARLVAISFDQPFYKSQILYRQGLPIKTLADLRGKRFAFVDPASTSGYLFPAALIKRTTGEDPVRFFSQMVFVGGHDKVVIAIYQESVDAGATLGDEFGRDARDRVIRAFPDVKEKVRVLLYTNPIPNEAIAFRRGLGEETKLKLAKAMIRIAETAPGKEALPPGMQGFADLEILQTKFKLKIRSLEEYFDIVRDVARYLGINLEELIRPR